VAAALPPAPVWMAVPVQILICPAILCSHQQDYMKHWISSAGTPGIERQCMVSAPAPSSPHHDNWDAVTAAALPVHYHIIKSLATCPCCCSPYTCPIVHIAVRVHSYYAGVRAAHVLSDLQS
jgi:hypothetical protein